MNYKAGFHLATRLLLLVILGYLISQNAYGASQNPSASRDANSISAFVNSTAKEIYGLAWPTATYREVSISQIVPATGGFDVAIKVSGQSGFDGSDLWLRLVIEIRDGGLHDVHVLDHNALLAAPFSTVKAFGSVVAQMARDYDQQSHVPNQAITSQQPVTPARPEGLAAAVCIGNSTGRDINFNYRWGDDSWKPIKVLANRGVSIWWPYPDASRTSPSLEVKYVDNLAAGSPERSYALKRMQSPLPVSCDRAAQYNFDADGVGVVVHAMQPD